MYQSLVGISTKLLKDFKISNSNLSNIRSSNSILSKGEFVKVNLTGSLFENHSIEDLPLKTQI